MTAATPLRIALVDDHALVREGLRSMLESAGLQIVGEAATGREALELVRREHPALMLMDVRMPDMHGLAALTVIKAEWPSVAIIMLTTYENPEYFTHAILGGASGYLLKTCSRQTLLDAITTVAEGGTLLDRTQLTAVVQQANTLPVERAEPSPENVRLAASLTERERTVLRLLVEGLSNREIADKLSISPGTVKTHVEHIIAKLNVSDRTQAAVWAVRQGLAR